MFDMTSENQFCYGYSCKLCEVTMIPSCHYLALSQRRQIDTFYLKASVLMALVYITNNLTIKSESLDGACRSADQFRVS